MDVKDEIKEKLNIVDVVSQYVKLKSAGQNFVGLSPFSSEKSPSFYVSPDRGLYYCFSTSQGGDIFTFVQKMEGLDFRGALKLLAEKAGVSLRPEDRKKWEERDVLFAIMEEATRFFESQLKTNNKALQYLHGRGLEQSTIDMFRVGFAPEGWREIKDHLESRGFNEVQIEKVGLIKKTDKGAYDRFRSRIMFPISDSSGRIIAFSGRIFIGDESKATEDQKNAAKYLNSPDTVLFNKGDVFFGLDKAKNAIKKYNFAILVEGQMDLLMLHQIGYTNTIAGSGTALTDKTVTQEGLVSHMGILHRLTKNLLLAYDSDKAGVNAARKAARTALTLGMDTKVVEMPTGVDPADFVKDNGKDGWAQILKNAVSIIEFLAHRIVKDEADILKRSKRIRDEVLPELSVIPSAIEQEYYLKKLSEITDIPYSALQQDLESIVRDHGGIINNKEVDQEESVMHTHDSTPTSVRNAFGLLWYFEDRDNQEYAEQLRRFMQRFSGNLFSHWESELSEDKQALIFEGEIRIPDQGKMNEIFENTALDFLRHMKPIYKSSISQLEKLPHNEEKIQSVMTDFTYVVQMIENHDQLQKELYGTKKDNN